MGKETSSCHAWRAQLGRFQQKLWRRWRYLLWFGSRLPSPTPLLKFKINLTISSEENTASFLLNLIQNHRLSTRCLTPPRRSLFLPFCLWSWEKVWGSNLKVLLRSTGMGGQFFFSLSWMWIPVAVRRYTILSGLLERATAKARTADKNCWSHSTLTLLGHLVYLLVPEIM